MFAGAAFTDQADIKATDAVNMLSALGVINGYDDGSYKPDATVTRAEMAKMIFVVRNNKIDDSAYKNNSTKLTDVNNHWAAGYIKFCESQGIIAGKGNNKFDPDATVTGVEAAKMLLVVSGYDAQKAGLIGSAWQTNVLKYAGAAGILDDVNSALESGLPRQYAAQMIYNALDVYRVKWSKDSESFDDVLNGGIKETVGHAYMGLCSDYGYLTAIKSDSLTIDLDSTYSADNYHTGNGNVTFSKVKTDYSALLGQTVKVMFKDGKTNNVLGVYAVSDNTTYTTFMNQTELSDKDTKIKFGGKSYSVDDTTAIKLTVDGNPKTDVNISYFKDTAANKVSMNKVTFVDTNKNNKIDKAIITTYTGAEVTYVGADQITAGGKSYKFADENIDKTIARDDWAVISENLYKDNKDIVKADVLNTKLTGFKEKTGYVQYQLDGKWYNMASVDGDVATGDNVKAYVFNGVVLDLDSEDGDGSYPTNVAIVVGKGNDTLSGDQAKIRYFNGEVKTVTIDDDSTVTPVIGSAYKVSAAGSDIKFEALVATRKYNGYTFVGNNKSTNVADDKIDSTKVDDSAVIVLYDGNGASKQITGKQYNALVASDVISGNHSAVFTKETNGLTRVRMASVMVPRTSVSGKSNDNYAYITSDGVENANNKTAITIWTGSENKDVVVDTGYSKGEYVKGMLIGYSSIDEKGIINDVDVIGTIKSATNFPTTGVDTNTLYRGSNKANVSKYIAVNDGQLNVTADTKVLVVDSDADSKSNIGIAYNYGDKLPKASKNGDDYLVNAMWVMDEVGTDDKDIEVLVIDSTGAFKGFKIDDVNAAKATATADSTNVKSVAYGTAATLKFDLALANYEKGDKVTFKAAVTDKNGNAVTTGISGDLIDSTGVSLTANDKGVDSADDKTVVFANSVVEGVYTVTVKAGTSTVATAKLEVVAATVANLDATVADTTVLDGGKVVIGKKLADIKGAVTAATNNVAANAPITVAVVGRDVAETYVPVAGEKVTVSIKYTAAEHYQFTKGTTVAAMAGADGVLTVNADGTATVVYTFIAQ